MSVIFRTALFASICACLSVQTSTADEQVDYLKQIKPVFQARCYACHGALKQEGNLRLDTQAQMVQGGDSGPALIAGDVEASLLVQRVSSVDESERMPPEGEPLKPEEIAALSSWIAAGAAAPQDEQPEHDPRDHWAFRTPVRPAVPHIDDPRWSQNPIDSFIAAKHRELGLVAQPPADKPTWLRRVTFDLIGLPPSIDELDAFLADDSPQAYETVVNRLLDSPQYGERWGRHWMDIWRYSDWWGLGAEVRNSQKHIWHFRDWIIESLNADKGYDQMLREMLAADELYPNDFDRLRGSGFLARQYFKFNRTTWLDGAIEHTSKAMLGLTFNCGKCHDHKYDPLSQQEYYQLRAFFEPYQIRTEAVPGEIDFEKDGIPRPFDCNLDIVTYLHIRGDDRNPDTSREISPTLPAFLNIGEFSITPVSLPPEAHHPGLRPFVKEALLKQAESKIAEAKSAVEVARRQHDEAQVATMRPADAHHPDNVGKAKNSVMPLDQAELQIAVAEYALKVAELQPASMEARFEADRAKFQSPVSEHLAELIAQAVRAERLAAAAKADEEVCRAELDVLKATPEKKADAEKKLTTARESCATAHAAVNKPGDTYTSLLGALKTLENNLETEDSRRKPFPTTSTGRRTALAMWITDPKHPLPARVCVNHLWGRHFGKAIVPTVFDFGRKGTPPTHPELLDWLAVELVENQWSMKHIHRLMTTSQTYRMSSSKVNANAQTMTVDPDNKSLWRMNSIRMEAQSVRDSLLDLAGVLDLTQGGPSIPVNDEASRRRSIYFVHSHNEHQQFLSTFDDASVLECYRRAESIVPQQALAMENSPLAGEMAEKIAQRIQVSLPDSTDDAFVRQAFRWILCNEPNAAEHSASLSALTQLIEAARRAQRPDPVLFSRTTLIQALLNHNDFVTIR